MAGNDIGIWYRNIPEMTKYWFTGSIVLPLAGRIGIVSYFTMILDYSFISQFHVSFSLFYIASRCYRILIYLYYAFVGDEQLWRPLTSVMYYPLTPSTGFHYLIMLYFLYSYSTRLETGEILLGSEVGQQCSTSDLTAVIVNQRKRPSLQLTEICRVRPLKIYSKHLWCTGSLSPLSRVMNRDDANSFSILVEQVSAFINHAVAPCSCPMQ